MTLHANHQTKEGSMCHPFDAEAWRHFDQTYPDFAAEPRNVRLSLCTNGFAPHGQYDRTYSCWLITLTSYNLSPRMCISSEYMFLKIVIPGPSNPKRLIDIYLEPLIEELQNLWHVGVLTCDNVKNKTFLMRVALMWTEQESIHYEPSRKKGCTPRLKREQIREWVEEFSHTVEVSLSLLNGYGKKHKWTKKSILWELEYWSTYLIRHNPNVMHIEKIVFDNIFNTMTDIKGKTKDTLNARKDLKFIYNRPELEVNERRPNMIPKAVYTLTKEQKMRICAWISHMKFPDGYAPNLTSCVNIRR
ncbi:UNVERIFIED_CONTAM: hypothetical protein Sindi_1321200 [Sesamum indicum]